MGEAHEDGGFSRASHFSTGVYIEKGVLDARERAESKTRWLDENKVGLKVTVPKRKTGCEPYPSNAVAERQAPASSEYVEPSKVVTASRLASKKGWLETEKNGGTFVSRVAPSDVFSTPSTLNDTSTASVVLKTTLGPPPRPAIAPRNVNAGASRSTQDYATPARGLFSDISSSALQVGTPYDAERVLERQQQVRSARVGNARSSSLAPRPSPLAFAFAFAIALNLLNLNLDLDLNLRLRTPRPR